MPIQGLFSSLIFRAKVGLVGGWLSKFGTPGDSGTTQEFGIGVGLDSSNNIYFSSTTTDNNGWTDGVLNAKFNSSGTVQWQKKVKDSTLNEYASKSFVDSSGNVYAVGTDYDGNSSTATTFRRGYIVKYNSSGVLQWQRTLASTGNYLSLAGVYADSSGNVYVVGNILISGNTYVNMFIAKYNSSGTIQWQRRLYDNTYEQNLYGTMVDSSGNIYVTGYVAPTSTNYKFFLAKYDSTPTLQYQISLGVSTSGNYDVAYQVITDSSGNTYFAGKAQSGGLVVAKYTSTGTLSWQKIITFSSSTDVKHMILDSSGNIVIVGILVNNGFIVKLDTSGGILLQRTITNVQLYACALDSTNSNIYLAGSTTGGTGNYGGVTFMGKLPYDGSGTGTYTLDGTTHVYAASSASIANSTYTSTTTSFTDAAGTATDATPTYTDSTTAFTQVLVNI